MIVILVFIMWITEWLCAGLELTSESTGFSIFGWKNQNFLAFPTTVNFPIPVSKISQIERWLCCRSSACGHKSARRRLQLTACSNYSFICSTAHADDYDSKHSVHWWCTRTVTEDADDGPNKAHDVRGRNARLVLPGRAATIRRVSESYIVLRAKTFDSFCSQICKIIITIITVFMSPLSVLLYRGTKLVLYSIPGLSSELIPRVFWETADCSYFTLCLLISSRLHNFTAFGQCHIMLINVKNKVHKWRL